MPHIFDNHGQSISILSITCVLTASVYTNLTLVTEEKLDFIREHYIQLITSVDFKEARKHDKLRGKKGAFAKTIEMLDYAKKIGINIRINSMLNDKSVEEILELREMINLYTENFVSNIIIPTGRARYNYSFKDYELLFKIYAYLNSNSYKENISLLEIENFDFSQVRSDYCNVAEKFVFIDYLGNYILCPSLRIEDREDFSFGNIDTISLTDMIEKMRKKNVECKFLRICKAAEKCKGGCRSRAFLIHDDINSPDTVMCKLYNIECMNFEEN